MISELLTGIFLHSNINSSSHPSVKGENIVIERKFESPYPSSRRLQIRTPRPTNTPRPSAPKPSAAVKPVQTSGINRDSVLQALNDYRSKNGVGGLQIDSKLQEYAQSRADHLKSLGKLDKHAGHKEFMNNDGFSKLGFNAIAENQGYNYRGDAKGLVASFYGKSSGHNKNQLNSEYTHVGIGISGAFTNLVFGGSKR